MSELDVLIRRFQQGHGAAIGITEADRYRLIRLDARGDASERFRIRFFRPGLSYTRDVLLKRYGRERAGIDVVNELRGLRIANATLGPTAHFGAPEPFACSVEDRALFMEYCPSVRLNKVIFLGLRWSRVASFAAAHASLLEIAAEVGALLSCLQAARFDAESELPIPTPTEVIRRYVAELGERLGQWKDARLPASLGRRVGEYVSDRLTASRDEAGPVVFQHSDFGPWNLLRSFRRLYVTDLHTFTLGHPDYDRASFATARDCLARYRTVDAMLLGRMRSTFLRTARDRGGAVDVQSEGDAQAVTHVEGAKQSAPESPLFQALSAMHMIYFAWVHLARRAPMHEVAYAPYRRRRFIVAWFEERLERG